MSPRIFACFLASIDTVYGERKAQGTGGEITAQREGGERTAQGEGGERTAQEEGGERTAQGEGTMRIVDDVVGRGIFAKRDFQCGEYICEYAGELIEYGLAKEREGKYDLTPEVTGDG